jgi:hypothetical protein
MIEEVLAFPHKQSTEDMQRFIDAFVDHDTSDASPRLPPGRWSSPGRHHLGLTRPDDSEGIVPFDAARLLARLRVWFGPVFGR